MGADQATAQPETDYRRLAITIHGAVQGVGFRPFIYRLATELALTGWVINDSRGVQVEVEGDSIRLAAFLDRIVDQAPPHARILDVATAWLPLVSYANFEIRHSDSQGAKTVLVLPDLATCPDCLADVLDPANRRHRYPFTNCTNCGPRFSIVEALPYDRPNTTMRGFTLCPACRHEYENPRDRRFHAQPNACPVCGPQLTLLVRSDNSLTQRRQDAKHLPEADELHNSLFTIHKFICRRRTNFTIHYSLFTIHNSKLTASPAPRRLPWLLPSCAPAPSSLSRD